MHQQHGVEENLLGQHVIAHDCHMHPGANFIPRPLRELNRHVGDFNPPPTPRKSGHAEAKVLYADDP